MMGYGTKLITNDELKLRKAYPEKVDIHHSMSESGFLGFEDDGMWHEANYE